MIIAHNTVWSRLVALLMLPCLGPWRSGGGNTFADGALLGAPSRGVACATPAGFFAARMHLNVTYQGVQPRNTNCVLSPHSGMPPRRQGLNQHDTISNNMWCSSEVIIDGAYTHHVEISMHVNPNAWSHLRIRRNTDLHPRLYLAKHNW